MNKELNVEEQYFLYWLEELKDKGCVDWIYDEEKSFVLNQPVMKMYKNKEFTLIKSRKYTPDFIFRFNKKMKGILYYEDGDSYKKKPLFYCNNNRGIIYVDVKGEWAQGYNSSTTFQDRKVIMMQNHNIYVEKVKPFMKKPATAKRCLLAKTFTPQKVIDTEVYQRPNKKKGIKKGDSKLRFQIKTIDEFLTESGIIN